MRIKILFFLILLSASVFSQKVDEDQVPKDVLIAIETVHSGAKVKSWELKDNNYIATAKLDGQIYKVEITPEGKWLNSKSNVNEKELPSLITKYMSDNFEGCKIKSAQYVEDNEEKNYYILKIQKKGISSGDEYELTFDPKGNLTNSTAPESAKTVKKKTDDEDSDAPKRDKVTKKETKVEDDEDTKTDEKVTKSSKSSKTTKETTASKSKVKSKNDAEDTDEDKPIKKTTTKKATTGSADRSTASKTKTQKPAPSNTKTKKLNLDGDDEVTSNGSAPATVKKTFEKKFPNSQEASWKKVDSNYVVSFVFRDMDQKVEFTPEAKLVSTTKIMDPKNIFRPLENYLEKNYKKYKVMDAQSIVYDRNYVKQFPEKKLKSYYVVKISQKVKRSKKPKITTIYFDSKGTLDRVEEGDFEDEDQGDNDDSNSKKKSKKNDDEDNE